MSEINREAMFYNKIGNGLLRCELCPNYCVLNPGERGKCRGKNNIGGKLIAANYAQAICINLDPIEKKPLYHYRPGSRILSTGPNSCNLACRFCQNYRSSQYDCPTMHLSTEALYQHICRQGKPLQIAFTYTEPWTWYEYIYDFATQHPDVDIALISNGFINPDPLSTLLPHIKAMNIDLKSSTDDFYRNECAGKFVPVQNCIKMAFNAGIHLEVTFLMIPGLNDTDEDIIGISEFLGNLCPEIPLHISAYHPEFRMNIHATPAEDIFRAVSLARKRLKFVYGGNVLAEDLMQTRCPSCNKIIVSRSFGAVRSYLADDARCPECRATIYGIFC